MTALHEAVVEIVHDGDSVVLEEFTHLIPFAAPPDPIKEAAR